MIAEAEVPAGVWNYRCPTCGAGRGMKCDTPRGRAVEAVHQARLDAYRADPTWTAEAEAEDVFGDDGEDS